LINHAAAQEQQIERIVTLLKANGLQCGDIESVGKSDPAQLNKLVD
jgi:serine O-acetyltransferase